MRQLLCLVNLGEYPRERRMAAPNEGEESCAGSTFAEASSRVVLSGLNTASQLELSGKHRQPGECPAEPTQGPGSRKHTDIHTAAPERARLSPGARPPLPRHQGRLDLAGCLDRSTVAASAQRPMDDCLGRADRRLRHRFHRQSRLPHRRAAAISRPGRVGRHRVYAD